MHFGRIFVYVMFLTSFCMYKYICHTKIRISVLYSHDICIYIYVYICIYLYIRIYTPCIHLARYMHIIFIYIHLKEYTVYIDDDTCI